MFVRFRVTLSSLQASIVETRRIGGRVRHEHVAALGSIKLPITPDGRAGFWEQLWQRLSRLSNRLDASAQQKIAMLCIAVFRC